jgi:hypothetical protein
MGVVWVIIPHAHGGEPHYKPLILPPVENYDYGRLLVTSVAQSVVSESGMEKIGAYLRDIIQR